MAIQHVGPDRDISSWYDCSSLDDFVKILEPGYGLEFDRGPYRHWALYESNDMVIHFNGEPGIWAKSKAAICRDRIGDILGRSKIRVNNRGEFFLRKRKSPLPLDQILLRARSKLGASGYSLIENNCEHFVNWCRFNVKSSRQVSNAVQRVAISPGGVPLLAVMFPVWAMLKTTNKMITEIKKTIKGRK